MVDSVRNLGRIQNMDRGLIRGVDWGGGIGVFPIELQFESVGMKILGVEMH